MVSGWGFLAPGCKQEAARSTSPDFAPTLRDSGFADLTEGTLYPLLLRLERKGLIAAEYRAGSGGPSRKYYRLTPDGVQYLNEFTEAWQNASDTVNRILHDKEG